ncbi:endophilin-A-like [Oppia nitens]|uniref:endophilin-A-like n=1 Tax=Oppia nitens TaxID=1686743 RepID=UPI0023DC473B|nr:endophilin-A-like [Oppia nitens]
MSLSGLKKQYNKANQFVSERIGGAEATKSSDYFVELEKKTDITQHVVHEMLDKTRDVLYPNPALRARVAVNTKLMGNKNDRYVHPELELADSMYRYGKQFDNDNTFGQSLVDMGETLKKLTDIKYSFEDQIKDKFLDPLMRLQSNELKQCQSHRKKLESRRLDYDCHKRKKQKGGNVSELDLKLSEDKYNESYELASMAMENLMALEMDQLIHMTALSEALYDYHIKCADVLKNVVNHLNSKSTPSTPLQTPIYSKPNTYPDLWPTTAQKSQTLPKTTYCPKPTTYSQKPTDPPMNTVNQYRGVVESVKFINKQNNVVMGASKPSIRNKPILPTTAKPMFVPKKPKCRALYDFDAQNADELTLRTGDIIELNKRVDDNWFEGTLNGRTGLFPTNYVDVLIPLNQ